MALLPRELFFAETPPSQRRLVLLLYGLIGPSFTALLLYTSEAGSRAAAVVAVVCLILTGAAWVALRRRPRSLDFVYPVAISPTICCGIAFVASGSSGGAFFGVMAAPLGWSAVMLDAPVVLAAWVTATLTCFVTFTIRRGPLLGTLNTLLFSSIVGLVAWVVFETANRLRGHRARDKALIAALPDTLVRADGRGRFLEVFAPPGDALPLPREQLVGRNVADLVTPEVASLLQKAIERTLATGSVESVEYAVPYGDVFRHFEARLARSGPDEVVVIRRDISERRRAEADRELLGVLVAHMQEAFVSVDTELRIRSWSGGAQRLYGWKAEEVIGRPVFPLVQPDLSDADARRFAAHLASRGGDRILVQQRRRDGTPLTVDAGVAVLNAPDGSVDGFVAVCRDVTEQRALEARAIRAERLASVGTLVRGMAHEMNNPLASVLANLAFALEEVKSAAARTAECRAEGGTAWLEELARSLRDAATSAGDLRDIVAKLRAFTGIDQTTRGGHCQLRDAVDDALRLARDALEHATVSVDVPELPLVAVTRAELAQVFASVLENAGQASGERQNQVSVTARLRDAGHVVARVSDTGAGMPASVLKRAVDPFFTTKGPGGGRGLGLSVCLGVLQSVGGDLQLQSAVGQGTTVTLLLPVHPREPD